METNGTPGGAFCWDGIWTKTRLCPSILESDCSFEKIEAKRSQLKGNNGRGLWDKWKRCIYELLKKPRKWTEFINGNGENGTVGVGEGRGTFETQEKKKKEVDFGR
jgi:hypothetical protein